MQIEISQEMLEEIISDYDYWHHQLESVIDSNASLKHFLAYGNILEHLKQELNAVFG
jgi:hypothetical protein